MKKLLFLSSFLLSLTLLFSTSHVKAAEMTKVVRPNHMATSFADVMSDPSKWFFFNDENNQIDNTLGSFVNGPDTSASVQISVTGTQRRNLATYQFSGTHLADITTLAFSTYNPSAGNAGSVNRSGYLNFNVDFDGSDTWQRRLVFVPSKNGTVLQNTWQEWDAIQGGSAKWSYSGPTWPGTATSGTTLRTWDDILTSYPGVRVRVSDSWLGIRVGEPYADGYTENIDMFKFGVGDDLTIFDFEMGVARSAAITSPSVNEEVTGLVNFNAYLMDDDFDAVQWAIRKGTCNANQGTVWGNVDGKTDVATWEMTETDKYEFAFSTDVTGAENGMYCFVFNPVEDAGETDIRLTREFTIMNDGDDDEDGVLNSIDMCPNTMSDQGTWSEKWGTNRYQLLKNEDTGVFSWFQKKPKGGMSEVQGLDYTYGCSGQQILDIYNSTFGSNMSGHSKFGLSSGLVDEFHMDMMDGILGNN